MAENEVDPKWFTGYGIFPEGESELQVLHAVKVCAQEVEPLTCLQDAKYEVDKTLIAGMLVHRLTAFVLQDQFASTVQTVHMDVPATWWQHFKRDAVPDWLTRIYGFRRLRTVRLKRYSQDVSFTEARNYVDYPPLPPEKFGRSVVVETTSRSGWYGND